MDVQESTIYTKYIYLAPKGSRVSKKVFHKLYEEYVKHPERKEKLIQKLRELSIKQGKLNALKNKNKITNTKTNKNKKMGKVNKTNKNKKSRKF